MELKYTIVGREARIDKIEEAAPVVSVPEELEGCPVTELGPYVLSGSDVEEIHLPPFLRKIGAYGFYECERLRRIFCFGRVTDLGAGLFAGVRSVELLDITEFEGEKSCFQELLSELRQTLRVRVRLAWAEVRSGGAEGVRSGGAKEARSGGADLFSGQADRPGNGGGPGEARLIFPEYFEESVENTPARILFIETHGCGHRYRYCFANRQFQYRSYDELFPHAMVQEPEELVTELALGRLLFPAGLSEGHRGMYLDYVSEHWQTAGKLLIAADGWNGGRVTNLEAGGLPWLVETVIAGESAGAGDAALPGAGRERDALGISRKLETLISMAQQAGDTEMVSWLMDYRHRRQSEVVNAGQSGPGAGQGSPGADCAAAGRNRRKRRFEL